MSTPDASTAPSETSSLSPFLPLDRLSLLRRALIVAGMAGPLVVWGREMLRTNREAPAMSVMLAPALLTVLLANLNHTGAQVVARGIWWFNLLFGTVAAVSKQNWEPALLALGAGIALLASWDAGIESGEETRSPFEPVAFRRSLLVSLTMAVAEVQLLVIGTTFLWLDRHRAYAAGAGACALLLAFAAYGIFRLKLWGVLLHLVTMVGVATLVAAAMKHSHRADPVVVWVGTVSVQMLLPMPMLLAILRRRPVRVGPPSAVPARLFAALVVLMMGASAVSGLLALRW